MKNISFNVGAAELCMLTYLRLKVCNDTRRTSAFETMQRYEKW